MTTEEILAMPAGRELDALVRWHVMNDGKASDVIFNVDSVNCPHYSTSIAAAWEVAERLQIGVVPMQFRSGEIRYAAGKCEGALGAVGVRIEMAALEITAPLAICRAALVAMPSIISVLAASARTAAAEPASSCPPPQR